MPNLKLTNEIIAAAIQGFEFQRASIDAKIADLRAMLSGSSTATAVAARSPEGRRSMSAAGRARIAEAQRKRWAKVRGESASAAEEPIKPKRKLSPAAKAKLVANLKKARAAKAAKAKMATRAIPSKRKAATTKAVIKTTPAKAAKRAPVKTKVAKIVEAGESATVQAAE